MTIEALDVDFSNTLTLDEWLKSNLAGDLQEDLEKRIMQFLFNGGHSEFQFQKLIEQLAWLGSGPKEKLLLEREIVELNDEAIAQPCGLWKAVSKTCRFIANHKVEILVGIALCATAIGIAAVTGYTLSAVACGVVVAGAGSIFASQEKPNPLIPHTLPPGSISEKAIAGLPISPPLPKLELPSSAEEVLITADGIWVNGQFIPNDPLMERSLFAKVKAYPSLPNTSPETPESQSLFSEFIASLPKPIEGIGADAPAYRPDHFEPLLPLERPHFSLGKLVEDSSEAPHVISRKFLIQGEKKRTTHIGWINGINNTFEESVSSARHVQTIAGSHSVSGIYNCTHTPIVDVLEAGVLNHNGVSLVTAEMLIKEWEAFDQANKGNPNARLLQICHSQGAIHVKNALENAPPHIRDRVIVVAIAPAAVVPDRLCFKSFNYASEKDIVHKLEPAPPRPVDSLTIDDVLIPTFGERTIDERKELIILKAHPEATGMDHSFQSPTYYDPVRKHLENYQRFEGIFLFDERGKL